jgi:uncharacterized protein YggL (DUF469 family)
MEARNLFWAEYIRDAIEENGLTYGGLAEGFVCTESGASAVEGDRMKVGAWLASRSEVLSYKVGELINSNPVFDSLYPLLPE